MQDPKDWITRCHKQGEVHATARNGYEPFHQLWVWNVISSCPTCVMTNVVFDTEDEQTFWTPLVKELVINYKYAIALTQNWSFSMRIVSGSFRLRQTYGCFSGFLGILLDISSAYRIPLSECCWLAPVLSVTIDTAVGRCFWDSDWAVWDVANVVLAVTLKVPVSLSCCYSCQLDR